jgi:organic radical activating enzyme
MLENLESQLQYSKKIFVYGFGLAGKWLSLHLNQKINGYIDTDMKKVGKKFNGVEVFSLAKAKELIDGESTIIVAVIDIQDVLDQIKKLPHKNWLALGIYLNAPKINTGGQLGESDAFIKYSLEAVEKCHKGYLDEEKVFLRSVDVVITERCSLKCKDCSNLMQYYESPQNIPREVVLNDFRELEKNVDHIFEVRLIGGEPFMNKDIYSIIKDICESKKISRLVVYSNLMIPLKDTELSVLKNPKVVLSLTDYGELSKNTHPNALKLSENGIAFRLHPPENWTDSGKIENFNRTDSENEKLFDNCCGKNLITLSAGKIYRCPFAANADRLDAIPQDPRNYVLAGSRGSEIKTYTRQVSHIPACNFCKGRSFDDPEIVPAIQVKSPIKYQRYPKIMMSRDDA